MRINRAYLGLVFAVLVLLFSVLTLLFWDFVRDAVFVPITYFLWIIGLLVNSVPQGAYLALLVLLSLIIGAHILQGLRSEPFAGRTRRKPPATATRYRHWRDLCTAAYDNTFSRNRLAAEARKLALSILAHERGIDPAEVEVMVRQGALDLPETLRDVIENKAWSDAPLPNLFTFILSDLRRLVFRIKTGPNPDVERLIAELVAFVESHLEIIHAGNNPESR